MKQYFQDEIAGSGALAPLFTGILDAQAKIAERLENAEFQLTGHGERILNLEDAFPDADTEGHRRYHQTMIEMLEEKRKLRVAIQEKTISGLVWAGLLFVGLACWQYIKSLVERAA